MLNQIDYLVQLQEAITQLEELHQKRGAAEPGGEEEALQRKIDRLKKKVNHPTLRRFEMIIARRQGRALAPIRDSACGACGLILPHQTVIDVSTRQFLIPCEACGRLLYWDSESKMAGVEYRISHEDSGDTDLDEEPEREREPVLRRREKRKRFLSGPDQRAGEALIARLEAKRSAESESSSEPEIDSVEDVLADISSRTGFNPDLDVDSEPILGLESEAGGFASDESDWFSTPNESALDDEAEFAEPVKSSKTKRMRNAKNQAVTKGKESKIQPAEKQKPTPKKKATAAAPVPARKPSAKPKKNSSPDKPIKSAPKSKPKTSGKEKSLSKKTVAKKSDSAESGKKRVKEKAKVKSSAPNKKSDDSSAARKTTLKKSPVKKPAAVKEGSGLKKIPPQKGHAKPNAVSSKAAPKAAPKKKTASAKATKPKSSKQKSGTQKSAKSPRNAKKN